MNEQRRPSPSHVDTANQSGHARSRLGALRDNLSLIVDVLTLAILFCGVYVFNQTLNDTRGMVDELRREFADHDKQALNQMTEVKGRLEAVEKSVEGPQGSVESEVLRAEKQPQETESGTMGLIAAEYVGKPMYCRNPATNQECNYSDQSRIIAVGKWLLPRFPCGSQVTVCRLDIPTLCTQNVTVGDAFEGDSTDPRKFNTSPAIANELQYVGSGVADVIISRGTK